MKHGCWHQGAKNGHNATHSEGIEGLWEPENTWPILTKESRHTYVEIDVSGCFRIALLEHIASLDCNLEQTFSTGKKVG